AIRDDSDGVGPWGEHKRLREHPLPRLRGYSSDRIEAPSGLGAPLGLIECPEHLPNAAALIGEGDLELDVWLRNDGIGGGGRKGHQRREGVVGGRGWGRRWWYWRCRGQIDRACRWGRGDQVALVIGDDRDPVSPWGKREALRLRNRLPAL